MVERGLARSARLFDPVIPVQVCRPFFNPRKKLMRLTRFKATNFRSVTDSEWIETERVTALIGVNESGKTNLLLPLWKLNPAREGEIKPTSDYPKDNYAAVRADPGDFDFITAEFDVSDLEDKLAAMTGVDRQFVDIVHVTRNFAGEYSVSFP